jgi:hypothetical protein
MFLSIDVVNLVSEQTMPLVQMALLTAMLACLDDFPPQIVGNIAHTV